MIKDLYKFKTPRQIWRVLVSDTDKLILETREMRTKEVFFDCMDINTGKEVFSSLQLEEKHWLGIEAIHNDVIIFHKYDKPDMPGHREMTAYDINTREILWTNDSYVFLFVYGDYVYAFNQGFDSRRFVALNFRTGGVEKELGEKYDEINSLREKSDNEKYSSDYVFPEIFNPKDDSAAAEIIRGKIKDVAIIGEVEYNVVKNLVLINFHAKVFEGSLANKFISADIASGKIVHAEILNADVKAYVPNSYFIYKDTLFMVKEKNELLAFKLE